MVACGWCHCASLLRFGGALHHRLLLDFLKKVAERYLQDQRAAEFVLDLLQLSVPKLFAVESSGKEKGAAASISAEFMAFLKDYITRNSLKLLILCQMKDILVCLIAGEGREGAPS